MVGAFIVFATYIAKDGFEESAKDRAATLNVAQIRYWQATNHEEEMNAIHEGPQQFGGGSDVLGWGNKEGDAWELVQNAIDELRFDPRDDLNNASILAREVIVDPKIQQDWNDLLDAEKKLRAVTEHAPRAFDMDPEKRRSRKIDATPEQQRFGEAALAATISWHDATQRYISAVVEAAEIDRERSEETVRVFTVVSYFLFFSGWAIAFLGMLLGTDVEQSATGP